MVGLHRQEIRPQHDAPLMQWQGWVGRPSAFATPLYGNTATFLFFLSPLYVNVYYSYNLHFIILRSNTAVLSTNNLANR